MKSLFSLCALLVVAAVAVDAAGETYTSMYDGIDLDEILGNQRLYKKYFDCIRGVGKCTPDGQELKKDIPDVLKTDCAKCTPKQKDGADKLLKHMLTEKPDDYKILEDQYDPESIFRKKYEEQKKAILEGKPVKLYN